MLSLPNGFYTPPLLFRRFQDLGQDITVGMGLAWGDMIAGNIATKLGLQVGVRSNLDVLNAEQQVLSAQRELAAARYNHLQSRLLLKAAVGILSSADLAEIDQYLRPPAAAKSSSSLLDAGVANAYGNPRRHTSDATADVQAHGPRMQLKMATGAPTTSRQR